MCPWQKGGRIYSLSPAPSFRTTRVHLVLSRATGQLGPEAPRRKLGGTGTVRRYQGLAGLVVGPGEGSRRVRRMRRSTQGSDVWIFFHCLFFLAKPRLAGSYFEDQGSVLASEGRLNK